MGVSFLLVLVWSFTAGDPRQVRYFPEARLEAQLSPRYVQ